MNKLLVQNISGKVVGEIKGSIYLKKGNKSQLFRKLNSYGVDKDVLDFIKEKGVKQVLVNDKENNRIVIADIDDFYKNGIDIEINNFGKQLHLKLEFWKEINQ